MSADPRQGDPNPYKVGWDTSSVKVGYNSSPSTDYKTLQDSIMQQLATINSNLARIPQQQNQGAPNPFLNASQQSVNTMGSQPNRSLLGLDNIFKKDGDQQSNLHNSLRINSNEITPEKGYIQNPAVNMNPPQFLGQPQPTNIPTNYPITNTQSQPLQFPNIIGINANKGTNQPALQIPIMHQDTNRSQFINQDRSSQPFTPIGGQGLPSPILGRSMPGSHFASTIDFMKSAIPSPDMTGRGATTNRFSDQVLQQDQMAGPGPELVLNLGRSVRESSPKKPLALESQSTIPHRDQGSVPSQLDHLDPLNSSNPFNNIYINRLSSNLSDGQLIPKNVGSHDSDILRNPMTNPTFGPILEESTAREADNSNGQPKKIAAAQGDYDRPSATESKPSPNLSPNRDQEEKEIETKREPPKTTEREELIFKPQDSKRKSPPEPLSNIFISNITFR